ncbi:MAG: hemerythrin domain-containing protein [Alphaproteobacteria bacterium]|nr:hemerythrin domain-containing protein [Alphaproteobacteria bacterium]
MSTPIHDLLLGDHARLDGLFDELESAAEAGAEAQTLRALWTRFEAVLRAHLAAEERELFPRLEDRHGVDVQELRAEHEQFRALLDRVGLEVDLHAVRAPAVQELIARLRAHADREDATVYLWADTETEGVGLLATLQALLAAATPGA